MGLNMRIQFSKARGKALSASIVQWINIIRALRKITKEKKRQRCEKKMSKTLQYPDSHSNSIG